MISLASKLLPVIRHTYSSSPCSLVRTRPEFPISQPKCKLSRINPQTLTSPAIAIHAEDIASPTLRVHESVTSAPFEFPLDNKGAPKLAFLSTDLVTEQIYNRGRCTIYAYLYSKYTENRTPFPLNSLHRQACFSKESSRSS
jgi:hypothetical protein